MDLGFAGQGLDATSGFGCSVSAFGHPETKKYKLVFHNGSPLRQKVLKYGTPKGVKRTLMGFRNCGSRFRGPFDQDATI